MRFRPVALALTALLVACDPAADPQPEPTAMSAAAPASTHSPAPSIVAPATSTVAPRPADGSIPGVFLLDWADPRPTGGVTFRPINPATGQDIPGFAPLDLLQAAQLYPSPDGKTFVAMVALSGSPMDYGKLSVIDLATWTMRDHARLPSYGGGLVWTPDSREVYFQQPRPDTFQRHEIARLDVAAGTLQVLGDVDFWVAGGLRLSPDGSRLYFLGMYSPDPRANILTGDPFLANFEVSTGEVRTMALPGILMGQVNAPESESTWGSYAPGLAVAPDGDRAYIADAASDRIVVVDLARMAIIEDKSIAKNRPAWKRGFAWLGGQLLSSAQAKGSEYHTSTVQFSRDGRYLFISGTNDEWCSDRPGPCVQSRPAGLRVLDVESLKVVLREDEIGSLRLSPDGRWLVGVSQWWKVPPADQPWIAYGSGLHIFDTATLERVAHLRPGLPFYNVVFDPASRYLLSVRRRDPGLGDRCSEPCSIVTATDLQSFEVVGERHSLAGIAILVPVAPP